MTSVSCLESKDRRKQKIQLVTADGNQEEYDHVILACHSDEALKILRVGGITEEEDRILSQIEWSKNEAVPRYIQMCGYVSIGRIPLDKDSRTLLVDASKSNGMVLLELSHNNRSG